MLKAISLLLIVGACLAYPADEVASSPSLVTKDVTPPQTESEPVPPVNPAAESQVPGQQKTEASDLKTDSTFWWGYRPVVYRSYVRPRYYSYYTYPSWGSYYDDHYYW